MKTADQRAHAALGTATSSLRSKWRATRSGSAAASSATIFCTSKARQCSALMSTTRRCASSSPASAGIC